MLASGKKIRLLNVRAGRGVFVDSRDPTTGKFGCRLVEWDRVRFATRPDGLDPIRLEFDIGTSVALSRDLDCSSVSNPSQGIGKNEQSNMDRSHSATTDCARMRPSSGSNGRSWRRCNPFEHERLAATLPRQSGAIDATTFPRGICR